MSQESANATRELTESVEAANKHLESLVGVLTKILNALQRIANQQ